ncbi:hypothetical protein A2U01_0093091, partial [Trifolium medium]|nr:hypothetical protein [Trifolium medium]
GALRLVAEEAWIWFGQLRAAQERMARRASQLEDVSGSSRMMARRAASYGSSRTFIVHRARRAE